MRDQPPPPPQSDHRTLSGQSATAFDDPEFLVALKRASESDNARFAAPPALGQRKWGKQFGVPDEAAASVATASCNSADLETETAGHEQASMQTNFSDLALSFANLD